MENTSRPRVAVIGCGHWGKNHVRNMHALGALAAVCETTEPGRELARTTAPGIPLFDTVEAARERLEVDGVVIATPAETHAALTESALKAGLDVLVEKPLALTPEDGSRLLELAYQRDRILMVGHLWEYHPAITKLHELVRQGDLGAIRYVYSNRLNLGKIRSEENILWSFAPHDISVILRLMGRPPFEVVATGAGYVQPNIADVTVTQLLFDNGVRAHFFVSWLHPYKEQRLVVVGSERMASFDDVAKELVLYDQRVRWERGMPIPVRHAGTKVPFPGDEPLRIECQAFLDAIRTRKPPLADGQSAVDVLDVLAAAQRSMITHGHPVQLSPSRGRATVGR